MTDWPPPNSQRALWTPWSPWNKSEYGLCFSSRPTVLIQSLRWEAEYGSQTPSHRAFFLPGAYLRPDDLAPTPRAIRTPERSTPARTMPRPRSGSRLRFQDCINLTEALPKLPPFLHNHKTPVEPLTNLRKRYLCFSMRQAFDPNIALWIGRFPVHSLPFMLHVSRFTFYES